MIVLNTALILADIRAIHQRDAAAHSRGMIPGNHGTFINGEICAEHDGNTAAEGTGVILDGSFYVDLGRFFA